jgi:hypothetical protein
LADEDATSLTNSSSRESVDSSFFFSASLSDEKNFITSCNDTFPRLDEAGGSGGDALAGLSASTNALLAALASASAEVFEPPGVSSDF